MISEDDDPEPVDAKERFLWNSEKGRLDVVKRLFDEDSTVIDYRDEDGYSALHRAAYEGCVEIAKFLIIKGANVNGKTLDGWTPLHSACNWNQLESCKILLWNGADINAQSNGLQTPLHIAASCKGAKDMLMLLLSNRNVKPELKNCLEETAYDIACRTDKYHKLFDMVSPAVNEY